MAKLAKVEIDDLVNVREMFESMVLQADAVDSLQTSLRFEFVSEDEVEIGDYIPEIYLMIRKKVDELDLGTIEPDTIPE